MSTRSSRRARTQRGLLPNLNASEGPLIARTQAASAGMHVE